MRPAGVGLLTTSDATPTIGDGLCVLSAVLFGVQKWRSETATIRFRENTQELIAVQLGTLALAASIMELPKLSGLVLSHSPGQLLLLSPSLPLSSNRIFCNLCHHTLGRNFTYKRYFEEGNRGYISQKCVSSDLMSIGEQSLTARHAAADQIWRMATGLPWPLLVYMGLATTAFTLWVEINALKASAIHIMAWPLLPLHSAI